MAYDNLAPIGSVYADNRPSRSPFGQRGACYLYWQRVELIDKFYEVFSALLCPRGTMVVMHVSQDIPMFHSKQIKP
jgi:hypothetical protein